MKKNNAIEKVENLTNDNKKTKKSAYKPDIGTDNANFEDLKEAENKKMRTENAIKARQKKDEKQQNKLKLKREKEKAKRAKIALKNKRKEEYKAEKLRRKEERLARRDMLKHESKEERQKRILAQKKAVKLERQKIREAKIKARQERAQLKRQKLENKRALKAQKRQNRIKERREKRNRGLGGWLTAVIALGSSTLILATLFMLSLFNMLGITPAPYGNVAAETYYSLVDYIDNMEVNMSKLMVSNDVKQQQRILADLQTQASLAAEDISRLPLKDESKYYTTKYINQVADYSKYLNNRLIDGDSLNENDVKNINSLYKINTVLQEELSKLNMAMGAEFDFNTIYNENSDNMFLEKFNELEKMAVEYPKLIYDGPFSDSLDNEKKTTLGEKVTSSKVEENFNGVFNRYNPQNVEVMGETQGKIACYSVKADASDGEIYANFSIEGGHLIMFNHYADCTEQNYSMEECIKIADKFFEDINLDGLEAVWATESGATCYINYCLNYGGAIIYPDMVKVTVCKQRGLVSSFDAVSYYLNHKPREIEQPQISQKDAITGLSADLSVLSTRLCVIPKGSLEVLAYEVFGTYNDSKYYVYVDAKTGKEVQIFCVVNTAEGELLI